MGLGGDMSGAPEGGQDPNAGAPTPSLSDPDPNLPATPPGFAPQGADPNAAAPVDPNMGMDASMGGGMPADDMSGDDGFGDEGMDDMGEDNGDDSTASIIDRLSDDDKEAVRKYALSMLDDDTEGGDMEGDEDMDADFGDEGMDDMGEGEPMPNEQPVPQQQAPAPMAESIILKKSQFEKLHEGIGLNNMDDKEEEKKEKENHLEKPTNKKVGKNNPFKGPRFY